LYPFGKLWVFKFYIPAVIRSFPLKTIPEDSRPCVSFSCVITANENVVKRNRKPSFTSQLHSLKVDLPLYPNDPCVLQPSFIQRLTLCDNIGSYVTLLVWFRNTIKIVGFTCILYWWRHRWPLFISNGKKFSQLPARTSISKHFLSHTLLKWSCYSSACMWRVFLYLRTKWCIGPNHGSCTVISATSVEAWCYKHLHFCCKHRNKASM